MRELADSSEESLEQTDRVSDMAIGYLKKNGWTKERYLAAREEVRRATELGDTGADPLFGMHVENVNAARDFLTKTRTDADRFFELVDEAIEKKLDQLG